MDHDVELSRTLTKAGNRGIMCAGYPMRLAYTGKKTMSWRCDVRGCKAYAHTDKDITRVLRWTVHNHGKHVSWTQRELELYGGKGNPQSAKRMRKLKSQDDDGTMTLQSAESDTPDDNRQEVHIEVMVDPVTGLITGVGDGGLQSDNSQQAVLQLVGASFSLEQFVKSELPQLPDEADAAQ